MTSFSIPIFARRTARSFTQLVTISIRIVGLATCICLAAAIAYSKRTIWGQCGTGMGLRVIGLRRQPNGTVSLDRGSIKPRSVDHWLSEAQSVLFGDQFRHDTFAPIFAGEPY